jgi:hypothetical protein
MLACLGAAHAAVIIRRRTHGDSASLLYDEDMPDAIQTLGLSGPPSPAGVPVEPAS